MTGCRGCLGLLVFLALLAWPIEQLQPVLGWSNAQTGGLLLAGVALLAIRSSVRGRGRRPARLMTVSGGEAREARAPLARDSDRIKPTDCVVARHYARPRDLRASGPGPRYRASGESPANRAGTPPGGRVKRARDPLPAQLRFGILQRDGFRCRYCGRPGSAPGVVLHVDHVVPLAAGGATAEDNLLTACDECNLGKATRAVLPVGP
jgi:5-methylcytosine-specific restriction endonuclease McrA